MWFVAGVLLGVVMLATIVGLHTGPHTHLAAGAVGVIAAAWLAFMVVDGSTRAPLLYSLLAADVAISGGVAFAALRGLNSGSFRSAGHSAHPIEGAMGTAVGHMSPDGIVRVRGENWSATSLNGEIAAGGAVQVVNVIGVRLQVWGEENMADRHLTGPAAEPPGVAAPPAPRDSASVIERSSNEPGTGGVLQ